MTPADGMPARDAGSIMKGNAVFKSGYNRCLHRLAHLPPGTPLPSENELALALDISRTTIRAVLAALEERGIVGRAGGQRHLARAPTEPDHFPDAQTLSAGAAFERRFLEWILQGDFRAGQLLNAAELARQFGTSTTTIRECLARFQHFGLLERRPNSSWLFNGITVEFVREIYDVREMFELRATRSFIERPDTAPEWRELTAIEQEHRTILAHLDRDFALFPAADERLHRILHESTGNRFILDFYNVVATLFHYTYRWNREDARQRSATALMEHLDYIDALRTRDQRSIDARCRKHLRTACATLIGSIETRAATPPLMRQS
ncbi:DNA-binding GntR family transcriptional regulator [Angulomicrobium tetraedrale]|uniref:DNA-binding GntR family transcriptional regulator n=1 Tax=Ancylobacter tetraedralis TaxID=217068 RepID=A0A839YYE8_9HYPH|nr:GntR family transcriptional regulator [Ancylobacter tetraedralis]MBB3769554.1 DNA-binding GntR family transcriptional regulator [Ancylobacter tetraedralis]